MSIITDTQQMKYYFDMFTEGKEQLSLEGKVSMAHSTNKYVICRLTSPVWLGCFILPSNTNRELFCAVATTWKYCCCWMIHLFYHLLVKPDLCHINTKHDPENISIYQLWDLWSPGSMSVFDSLVWYRWGPGNQCHGEICLWAFYVHFFNFWLLGSIRVNPPQPKMII